MKETRMTQMIKLQYGKHRIKPTYALSSPKEGLCNLPSCINWIHLKQVLHCPSSVVHCQDYMRISQRWNIHLKFQRDFISLLLLLLLSLLLLFLFQGPERHVCCTPRAHRRCQHRVPVPHGSARFLHSTWMISGNDMTDMWSKDGFMVAYIRSLGFHHH